MPPPLRNFMLGETLHVRYWTSTGEMEQAEIPLKRANEAIAQMLNIAPLNRAPEAAPQRRNRNRRGTWAASRYRMRHSVPWSLILDGCSPCDLRGAGYWMPAHRINAIRSSTIHRPPAHGERAGQRGSPGRSTCYRSGWLDSPWLSLRQPQRLAYRRSLQRTIWNDWLASSPHASSLVLQCYNSFKAPIPN